MPKGSRNVCLKDEKNEMSLNGRRQLKGQRFKRCKIQSQPAPKMISSRNDKRSNYVRHPGLDLREESLTMMEHCQPIKFYKPRSRV